MNMTYTKVGIYYSIITAFYIHVINTFPQYVRIILISAKF